MEPERRSSRAPGQGQCGDARVPVLVATAQSPGTQSAGGVTKQGTEIREQGSGNSPFRRRASARFLIPDPASHSSRSTVTGSTRAARTAGASEAMAATSRMNTTTAAYVAGSTVDTP